MPMKEILHRLQPIQVYIVLILSILYFSVQMFISQKSQSITLLVHAYHMLCNIIALSGCIITIKNNDRKSNRLSSASHDLADLNDDSTPQKEIEVMRMNDNKQQRQHEKSLKNTFGWARVDVLTMVIVCTFLTSLCFSIVVEVIQTLFHIEHKDHIEHEEEFHYFAYETSCIILGALGLILNGISYLLIGGYTYHQGSFLQLTADGNVFIMDRVVTDGRKISDSKDAPFDRKSQKFHELSRDSCSAIVLIICSIMMVFCNDKDAIETRLIDPIMSLISIVILLILSYPYMKEAAQILLQTIPHSIDIEEFQAKILSQFPEIESIHDLHIWQLTQEKHVSTAHIIFLDPTVYKNIFNDVLGFFHEQGINIVTIQPEFKNIAPKELEIIGSTPNGVVKDLCLVACRELTCEEKLCCKRESLDESEKSKTDDIQLEQVISVRNISAEELNAITNCTSAKSLNLPDTEDSSKISVIDKKHSTASLHLPSKSKSHPKLQKAISAIDREHQKLPPANEEIHLKKFVSESVIESTSDRSALDRQKSDILVENRMLKQLNKTNNEEIEDISQTCDKES